MKRYFYFYLQKYENDRIFLFGSERLKYSGINFKNLYLFLFLFY